MDRYASGGTLVAMQRVLQQYLREKGSTVKIKTLGFAKVPQNPSRFGTEILMDRDFGGPLRFGRRVAYNHREHHIVEDGARAKGLSVNPDHAVFRRDLYKYMRRDPWLDRALRAYFGR